MDSVVRFAQRQGRPWLVRSLESFGNVLLVDRRWLRGPLGVRKKYSGRRERERGHWGRTRSYLTQQAHTVPVTVLDAFSDPFTVRV